MCEGLISRWRWIGGLTQKEGRGHGVTEAVLLLKKA